MPLAVSGVGPRGPCLDGGGEWHTAAESTGPSRSLSRWCRWRSWDVRPADVGVAASAAALVLSGEVDDGDSGHHDNGRTRSVHWRSGGCRPGRRGHRCLLGLVVVAPERGHRHHPGGIAAILLAGLLFLFRRTLTTRLAFIGLAVGVGLLLGQWIGPSREPLTVSTGTMTLTLSGPIQGVATGPADCPTVPSGEELQVTMDPNTRLRFRAWNRGVSVRLVDLRLWRPMAAGRGQPRRRPGRVDLHERGAGAGRRRAHAAVADSNPSSTIEHRQTGKTRSGCSPAWPSPLARWPPSWAPTGT